MPMLPGYDFYDGSNLGTVRANNMIKEYGQTIARIRNYNYSKSKYARTISYELGSILPQGTRRAMVEH